MSDIVVDNYRLRDLHEQFYDLGHLITDSIDYLEWKTDKRAEGISFSLRTFSGKISGAPATSSIMLVLALSSYQSVAGGSEEDFNPVNLNNKVFMGIMIGATIVPAISARLSIIPMFWYKFDEKERDRVAKIVTERNESV